MNMGLKTRHGFFESSVFDFRGAFLYVLSFLNSLSEKNRKEVNYSSLNFQA